MTMQHGEIFTRFRVIFLIDPRLHKLTQFPIIIIWLGNRTFRHPNDIETELFGSTFQ